MTQSVLLTSVPSRLKSAGYQPPSYRDLYEAARSARIPAVQGANGRWTIHCNDIDRIVVALGLTREQV